MSDDYPADCRRHHGIDPISAESGCELTTDELCVLGMLKNQRAL
jgi:hypothetical protein